MPPVPSTTRALQYICMYGVLRTNTKYEYMCTYEY